MHRRSRTAALCAVLVACGEGGSRPAIGEIQPREGWIFQSLLDTPEGRTAYLTWLEDLDERSTVDNEAGLEVAGNGRIYTHGGRAWAGSGDSPTITPLQLDKGGITPAADLAVSLAGYGFAASPFGHLFVAEDEAYLFGDVVVVWNPLANELVGEISLEPARVGGRRPDAGVGVVRDGYAFVPVTYEAFPNIDDAVYVLVLDIASRSVKSVVSDDRCKSTGSISLLPDDTILVTGTHAYLLPEFGESEEPVTCILRIPVDSTEFDPSYYQSFQELTGGHDATSFQVLGGDHAVAFVFEKDEVAAGAEEDPMLYYTSKSSRWWSVDLGGKTASPIEGLPWVPSGSGIASSLGDGRVALALPEEFPAIENRLVAFDGTIVTELFAHSGRGVLSPL